MSTITLSLADLESLVIRALVANRTSRRNAAQVAAATDMGNGEDDTPVEQWQA